MDGNGEWIWNLDGVQRVPYHLPQLKAASIQDFIFIAEGEKDCDRLNKLGFVSTTNSGGAGKWSSEHNKYFRGRLVTIIPDNDVPGRKHAEQVANSLYGIAGEIRIIELPNLSDKEDVSDWLNNDGTKAELIRLTNSTKPFEPEKTSFNLTDAGNAERFAAMHGDKLRYCVENNRWYFWDGCRWNGELGGEKAGQLAIVTARAIADDAKNVLDSKEREKILLWSISCENAYRLRAMISLAQSQNLLVCHARDFDKDTYSLNCRNGTLDLRTGKLSEHRASDMLTKICPVEYEADAHLDLWDSFLADVTGGDRVLKDFLQIAFGYSLTGEVSEEKLFFVHGPTATGKSTAMEAVKAALGDYGIVADFETFLKRMQVGGARNDVARLAGAHFVVSIEVDEGAELAEGLVKILTGGDTVTARFLYRESFEFFPKFKLWLSANCAPRASDRDEALWRRILRIPFEHTIPEKKRDPKVKATLRDPEIAGPAILAWAVRGCLLWQQCGLSVPEIIRDATKAYRADQDPLRDFFADECEFGTTAFVPVSNLRKRYDDWGKETGLRYLLGPKQFNERLEERNCQRQSRRYLNDMGTEKVGKCWMGVTLQTKPTYANNEALFEGENRLL